MKGRRPWHKRYHEDALNGYMGLTLEERGVYSTCLDLIYMRGAPAAAGQAGGLASAESRRGHDGEHVQPVSATNSGVENFANSSGKSHELATRNNDINALERDEFTFVRTRRE